MILVGDGDDRKKHPSPARASYTYLSLALSGQAFKMTATIIHTPQHEVLERHGHTHAMPDVALSSCGRAAS